MRVGEDGGGFLGCVRILLSWLQLWRAGQEVLGRGRDRGLEPELEPGQGR